MFKYIFLLTILLTQNTPSLAWGCNRREYGDRVSERDYSYSDRKDERQTWEQIFNKLNISSQCLTNEELLKRQVEIEQREKALEREKESAIKYLEVETKNRLRQEVLSCYKQASNIIEFLGCYEGI